jgi:hypothetical protein
MTARRLVAVLACLGALMPAAAAGQGTVAPPGNSGIDEYLETVPAAGGNHKPGSGHGALSPAARKALDALGANGRAAAAASEATAPEQAKGGSGQGAHATPLPDSEVKVREPSGSPFAALGRALSGSNDQGGLGAWLPILLALTAAGFLGAVLVRRRSSS